MKKAIVIFVSAFLLFHNISFAQNKDIIQKLYLIEDIPYIPELSGDSLYWVVVCEGLTVVPQLIKAIDNTDQTQILIPNWGGCYKIGDIAFSIICEIIHGLPLLDMFSKGEKSSNADSLMTYHAFVERSKNRKILQRQLKKWYKKNHLQLIWINDSQEKRVADDWKFASKQHPAGGYFRVNNKS